MRKTITPKSMLLTMFLAASFLSNAQEQPKAFGKYPITPGPDGFVRCATVENELHLRDKFAKRASELEFEKWIDTKIEEAKAERLANPKSGNAVKMIPVVVHVIHNGDALGSNENISLERVQTQIEVLNEDYSQAAGTNAENLYEIQAAVNTGVQFCLAKIKPDGTTFDGVDRVYVNVPQYTTMQQVDQMKSETQWDPNKYLNIWTVNWNLEDVPGLLGYAQFPTNSTLQGLTGQANDETTDGVAVDWKSFGSRDKMSNPNSQNFNPTYRYGRTTTHEVGHFLGLRHIWGDEIQCAGNDYCNDTPVQSNKSSGCPDITTDTCPQAGQDMWQNFMDYTDDLCMSVFTKDQRTRMETVLANSPRRKSLLTSTVCGTLGTPDFKSLQGVFVSPNPAQDVINITTETETPDSYTIFNNLGQVITTVSNVSDANLSINISSYANGIYFLKIDKGSETKTIKFIKN